MSAENLAFLFATAASVIAVVSLYYIWSHIQKLREVDWG
jgi:hypothetical protein